MSTSYERYASVTVGRPGEDGVEITNLRITFEVVKTSESNANTAKISIYNLKESNRSRFEERDLTVILKAGYSGLNNSDGAIGILFKGNITKASSQRAGADYVTIIESGDAQKELMETNFEKSYSEGTTLKTIVNDLIASFGTNGVAKGVVKDITADKLINGGAFSGKAKEILNDLTKRMGIEWNIQDGAIHIEKGISKSETTAVLLNSRTGLIGFPVKREDGIQAVSLLNYEIKPNKSVKIESDELPETSGIFRVRKATYSGDTHGAQWVTAFEAI